MKEYKAAIYLRLSKETVKAKETSPFIILTSASSASFENAIPKIRPVATVRRKAKRFSQKRIIAIFFLPIPRIL